MIDQPSGTRFRPPTVPPAPPFSPEFFQDDYGRRRMVYRHLTTLASLFAASVLGSIVLLWWVREAALGSTALQARRIVLVLYLFHSIAILPVYLCRILGIRATFIEVLVSLALSALALANVSPARGADSAWFVVATLPPLAVALRCFGRMARHTRAARAASRLQP
jgi:peptidoglycan/LPS O-acetylase OafA/YrhL